MKKGVKGTLGSRHRWTVVGTDPEHGTPNTWRCVHCGLFKAEALVFSGKVRETWATEFSQPDGTVIGFDPPKCRKRGGQG